MSYALLSLMALAACHPACARDWALVGYLDGRGDLSADAAEHAAGMLRLPGSGQAHVAVSGPRGLVWSRENGRVTRRPTAALQSSRPSEQALSEFLEWVGPRTQGCNRVICLLGHGVPAAAGRGAGPPRLLHGDGDPGLTPDQLAECLGRHLGTRRRSWSLRLALALRLTHCTPCARWATLCSSPLARSQVLGFRGPRPPRPSWR